MWREHGDRRWNRAYAKYVCPSARYRGICSNKLYIRRDWLEEQLLDALAANLRRPELLEHALESFQKQLECSAREIRQAADSVQEPELRTELESATARARNLVEAIAVQRISPFLSQELARVEDRIQEITTILSAPRQAEQLQWSFDELRQFVLRKAENFVELLRGDPKLAKGAIQKHVGKLVLKPKQTAEGPVFEMTGDIHLFGGDSSVMLNHPVRQDYNQRRPHSALGYRTPEEFAAQVAARRASSPTPVAFPPGNPRNSPELAL